MENRSYPFRPHETGKPSSKQSLRRTPSFGEIHARATSPAFQTEELRQASSVANPQPRQKSQPYFFAEKIVEDGEIRYEMRKTTKEEVDRRRKQRGKKGFDADGGETTSVPYTDVEQSSSSDSDSDGEGWGMSHIDSPGERKVDNADDYLPSDRKRSDILFDAFSFKGYKKLAVLAVLPVFYGMDPYFRYLQKNFKLLGIVPKGEDNAEKMRAMDQYKAMGYPIADELTKERCEDPDYMEQWLRARMDIEGGDVLGLPDHGGRLAKVARELHRRLRDKSGKPVLIEGGEHTSNGDDKYVEEGGLNEIIGAYFTPEGKPLDQNIKYAGMYKRDREKSEPFPYPVASMARCRTKNEIEKLLGGTVPAGVQSILAKWSIDISTLQPVVIGLGPFGAGIADALAGSPKQPIVLDKLHTAGMHGQVGPFKSMEKTVKAIQNPRSLIFCAGRNVLTNKDYVHLRDSFIALVTSQNEQMEPPDPKIYTRKAMGREDKGERGFLIEYKHKENPDNVFYLLNNGKPANFIEQHSIANIHLRAIELLEGLSLMTMYDRIMNGDHIQNGIQQPEDADQELASAGWKLYLGDPDDPEALRKDVAKMINARKHIRKKGTKEMMALADSILAHQENLRSERDTERIRANKGKAAEIRRAKKGKAVEISPEDPDTRDHRTVDEEENSRENEALTQTKYEVHDGGYDGGSDSDSTIAPDSDNEEKSINRKKGRRNSLGSDIEYINLNEEKAKYSQVRNKSDLIIGHSSYIEIKNDTGKIISIKINREILDDTDTTVAYRRLTKDVTDYRGDPIGNMIHNEVTDIAGESISHITDVNGISGTRNDNVTYMIARYEARNELGQLTGYNDYGEIIDPDTRQSIRYVMYSFSMDTSGFTHYKGYSKVMNAAGVLIGYRSHIILTDNDENTIGYRTLSEVRDVNTGQIIGNITDNDGYTIGYIPDASDNETIHGMHGTRSDDTIHKREEGGRYNISDAIDTEEMIARRSAEWHARNMHQRDRDRDRHRDGHEMRRSVSDDNRVYYESRQEMSGGSSAYGARNVIAPEEFRRSTQSRDNSAYRPGDGW